jgi:hypothetical protein
MGSDRCGRTWVPLFDLLCAGGGEVGGGEHGQGDVGVPGPVAADLVVIEPGQAFGGLRMGRPRGEVPAGQVLFRAASRRTGRARFPGISALQ